LLNTSFSCRALRHLGHEGFFTSAGLGGFASPHRQYGVATSSSRALRSGTSRPSLGVGTLSRYKLGPRHTEHINQLSRFYAQKLSVLNFVRFDQALYFFDKKSFAKNFLCQNFVCDTQIQITRLLGGFLCEAIILAYDYTCTASFLVRVLRHNMHHIDLSDLQAGLPCSCVYPYVPDCSARE
jgi:hypothetical protein